MNTNFYSIEKEPSTNNNVYNMEVYKKDDLTRVKKNKLTLNNKNVSANETAFTSESNHGGGGGGGMNDILRRLDDLERNQRELKQTLDNFPSNASLNSSMSDLKLYIHESVSKLPNEDRIKTIMNEQLSNKVDKLPSEDRIKTIMTEQLATNKIATETYVESKINKARLTTVLWIVGIGVTILGTILTAILRKVIP
ncbi:MULTISPECIES: hypothetical protein [unclassified Paenibacillus]|uniref:hypothetical protein n=1 Tax=Paenibacillus TaxID=44249 RepID=UPI000CFBA415|nr:MULTISPECIES: hypothetical protein [unclassified Paenibacillus]PRA04814.1 hypothetical protein CQ043_12200 [Paenibacillus sp. MYb63]PRA47841.1 hypothetical protein CQ061_14630 [Paenibacillus sp. MYb67]